MKKPKATGSAFEANKKGQYRDPVRLIGKGQKSEVTSSSRHFILHHAKKGLKFQKPRYGIPWIVK